MLERVRGKSLAEIARDYNCGTATVQNYLDYARKHDLLVNQARNLLGKELVPLALAVYEAHLRDGSLQAAQDVLFGAGILAKTAQVKHTPAEDSLDSFRSAYFNAVATTAQDAVSAPTTSGDFSQPDAQRLPSHELPPLNESIESSTGRLSDVHDQGHEDLERVSGERSSTEVDPAR